jgi:hypothetical protein
LVIDLRGLIYHRWTGLLSECCTSAAAYPSSDIKPTWFSSVQHDAGSKDAARDDPHDQRPGYEQHGADHPFDPRNFP